MFRQIDVDSAQGQSWDMVVVGSSFSAMFFLKGLPKYLRVLVIEKGPLIEHLAALDTRNHRAPDNIVMSNTSDHRKEWVARSQFGGNSNAWWAQTPRFLPDDFRLNSKFGVGTDWPFEYSELEPFYSEVEALMEIAGDGRDHLFPMSAPFPFPSHMPTLLENELRKDDAWVPVATARSNGGRRATCCSNNVCSLCPIDSKFTILNSVNLFEHENVFILMESEVSRVLDLDRKSVSGVELLNSGQYYIIRAERVALAANALYNASILLNSGDENDNTGRFIHEQASRVLSIKTPSPGYFGGTSITGINYKFYQNADRGSRAAVMIENFNIPVIRLERGAVTNTMRLKLIAEDLPQARNRVVLQEDGSPKIEWYGHHEYAYQGIGFALRNLQDVIPWKLSFNHIDEYFSATEAHIQGTCRMGKSDHDGVVDQDLVKFGNDNLWILGASAFPSCSPSNPTLTLSALSLRAARKVA